MVPFFDKKAFNVLSPQAIVNNASFTCNVIDTLGYDYVELIVALGAVDIALTALKVQESDVKASGTTLTGGADVTGTVFGTSNKDDGTASTLPSATDDNHLFSIMIDCRARKRYLLPVITIGNGTTGGFVVATALLGRAENGPRTATEAGYTQRIMI